MSKTDAKTANPKLNRDWHLANRMPPKATAGQRLAWHLEHARVCGCRFLSEEALLKLRNAAEKEIQRGKSKG